MWYLLGAGEIEEEPTAGLPWVAAVVNKVAATARVSRTTAAVAAGAVGGATTAGSTAATTTVAGGAGGWGNCAP